MLAIKVEDGLLFPLLEEIPGNPSVVLVAPRQEFAGRDAEPGDSRALARRFWLEFKTNSAKCVPVRAGDCGLILSVCFCQRWHRRLQRPFVAELRDRLSFQMPSQNGDLLLGCVVLSCFFHAFPPLACSPFPAEAGQISRHADSAQGGSHSVSPAGRPLTGPCLVWKAKCIVVQIRI